MFPCLRTKCQNSSVIVTSFRQGLSLRTPSPLQNEPHKSPPRLGLTVEFYQDGRANIRTN